MVLCLDLVFAMAKKCIFILGSVFFIARVISFIVVPVVITSSMIRIDAYVDDEFLNTCFGRFAKSARFGRFL